MNSQPSSKVTLNRKIVPKSAQTRGGVSKLMKGMSTTQMTNTTATGQEAQLRDLSQADIIAA